MTELSRRINLVVAQMQLLKELSELESLTWAERGLYEDLLKKFKSVIYPSDNEQRETSGKVELITTSIRHSTNANDFAHLRYED